MSQSTPGSKTKVSSFTRRSISDVPRATGHRWLNCDRWIPLGFIEVWKLIRFTSLNRRSGSKRQIRSWCSRSGNSSQHRWLAHLWLVFCVVLCSFRRLQMLTKCKRYARWMQSVSSLRKCRAHCVEVLASEAGSSYQLLLHFPWIRVTWAMIRHHLWGELTYRVGSQHMFTSLTFKSLTHLWFNLRRIFSKVVRARFWCTTFT